EKHRARTALHPDCATAVRQTQGRRAALRHEDRVGNTRREQARLLPVLPARRVRRLRHTDTSLTRRARKTFQAERPGWSKLEQMASLEKRSVSNLIEVMADKRWERLTSIGGGVDAGEALAQGEDLVTA